MVSSGIGPQSPFGYYGAIAASISHNLVHCCQKRRARVFLDRVKELEFSKATWNMVQHGK